MLFRIVKWVGTAILVLILATVALAWLNPGLAKRFSYEGFARDRWQAPQRVLSALGLRAGDVVADIGAGGGYFTFRFAEAVGSGGKVYAVDVDSDMTTYVQQEARARNLGNVEAILAPVDDPRLPEAGVDVMFVCNTYHHIAQRAEYFRRAQRYLRPGGRLAIVELRGGGWLARALGLPKHSTPAETIRAEMESVGYRLEQQVDSLPHQHFLIFTRASETPPASGDAK